METKVLFLCVHNSGRSQMAEALMHHFGTNQFIAESAGFEPQPINPICIEAMHEIGIDISGNKVKEVFDLYRAGRTYNYIISVCDEPQHEKCPIFPGAGIRLTWPFPNPASLTGTYDEKLLAVRDIRDSIKLRIEQFIEEIKSPQSSK